MDEKKEPINGDVTIESTKIEATPEQPKKSKKDSWLENMKGKYPDVTDEDELYGKSMEGYDADHEALKGMYADNQNVLDKLGEDPQIGGFVADLINGMPIQVALANNFDEDELNMQEGDEGWNDYLKAREGRKLNKQKADEREKLLADNGEKSRQNILKYAEENGLTEDEVTEKLAEAFSLLKDANISPEFIDLVVKASKRDADIADAEEMGRVKGRNEKIVEEKFKHKGDGLPSMNNTSITEKPMEDNEPLWSKDAFAVGGYKKK